MELVLALSIIGVGIFAWVALKKFRDKPYIVNFTLALLLLLIIVKTVQMHPYNWVDTLVFIICGIGFVMQVFLGIKNFKSKTVETETQDVTE